MSFCLCAEPLNSLFSVSLYSGRNIGPITLYLVIERIKRHICAKFVLCYISVDDDVVFMVFIYKKQCELSRILGISVICCTVQKLFQIMHTYYAVATYVPFEIWPHHQVPSIYSCSLPIQLVCDITRSHQSLLGLPGGLLASDSLIPRSLDGTYFLFATSDRPIAFATTS